MFFAVTEDQKGSSGVINIDAADVCFIQLDSYRRIIELHTLDKKYFMPGTLTYWEDSLLKTAGYNFLNVDRNSIVNLDRIMALNRITKVAYFEETITDKSKSCPIAWHKFRKVSSVIREINPLLVVQ